MVALELIGVPFDGFGRDGHQARAASALRAAGLVDALAPHPVRADDDLVLPAPDPRRGPRTGLVNEAALVAMTERLDARVGAAVAAGHFPLVVGADCSTLLGTVPALRRVGDVGVLFVDGHEDTMPLDVSEDGEAANTEVGLLLGVTGRLLEGPLAGRRSVLPRDRLAVLGPRDDAWRARFNVGSLREHGVWLRDLAEVAADPRGVATEAVWQLTAPAAPWWLHVDLDVLDPEVLPSQGLPDVADEPGGLSWPQLTEVLVSAVASGGCVGWSVTIYDPEQDPDGADARRIVELVGDVVAALP